MTKYTVRYVDKLEIVENADDTFGIKTQWLKLNLYKGKDHISHEFNKTLLTKLLVEFDEKGGFLQTVGYNLSDILYPLDVKIKMDRKFIWSLQHVFKKTKPGFYDTDRIETCKRRIRASSTNLIIVYSIEISECHFPQKHLVARLVGFNITSSSNPSISFYSYNIQPMTIIKPGSSIKPTKLPVIKPIEDEKPYITLTNNPNGTIQISKSTWAHPIDDNVQKYYNAIIKLLDNNKPVYYNGVKVDNVVLVTNRKTGNTIYIASESGELGQKVTNFNILTTLAPITI